MSISYIVPVYNTGIEEIKRCIISIENFNDLNKIIDYEIIIINDGSKEEISNQYEKFVKEKKYIKYIHNKNNGVSFSRNQGIRESTKEYISFVDSDDYLINDNLEKEKITLEDDIIIFNIKIITKNKICRYNLKPGKNNWKNALEEHITNASFTNPVAKFYKKKFLIDNNILFNTKYIQGEDNFFNLEVLCYKPTIYYYDYPIYAYEFDSATTANRLKKNFNSVIEYIENIHNKKYEVVKNNNFENKEDIYMKINNKFINTCFGLFITLIETYDMKKIDKIIGIIKNNNIKFKDLFLKQKIYYLLIKYNNPITNYTLNIVKKGKKIFRR